MLKVFVNIRHKISIFECLSAYKTVDIKKKKKIHKTNKYLMNITPFHCTHVKGRASLLLVSDVGRQQA
jgi:hypothetical protein